MPAPPRTPPSAHPQNVEQFYSRDPRSGAQIADPELAALASAMATAQKLGDQLTALQAALAADASRSPEARAIEMRRAALELGERAARAIDGARAKAVAVSARLAAETAAPPPPRDAIALGLEAEMRTALARMAPEERAKVLSAGLASGDDRVVGAALRGPGFLAGLVDAQAEDLRRRYRQARFPEVADRLDRLGRALAAADRGGSAFLGFVTALADTRAARIAETNAMAAGRALEAVKVAP